MLSIEQSSSRTMDVSDLSGNSYSTNTYNNGDESGRLPMVDESQRSAFSFRLQGDNEADHQVTSNDTGTRQVLLEDVPLQDFSGTADEKRERWKDQSSHGKKAEKAKKGDNQEQKEEEEEDSDPEGDDSNCSSSVVTDSLDSVDPNDEREQAILQGVILHSLMYRE